MTMTGAEIIISPLLTALLNAVGIPIDKFQALARKIPDVLEQLAQLETALHHREEHLCAHYNDYSHDSIRRTKQHNEEAREKLEELVMALSKYDANNAAFWKKLLHAFTPGSEKNLEHLGIHAMAVAERLDRSHRYRMERHEARREEAGQGPLLDAAGGPPQQAPLPLREDPHDDGPSPRSRRNGPYPDIKQALDNAHHARSPCQEQEIRRNAEEGPSTQHPASENMASTDATHHPKHHHEHRRHKDRDNADDVPKPRRGAAEPHRKAVHDASPEPQQEHQPVTQQKESSPRRTHHPRRHNAHRNPSVLQRGDA